MSTQNIIGDNHNEHNNIQKKDEPSDKGIRVGLAITYLEPCGGAYD